MKISEQIDCLSEPLKSELISAIKKKKVLKGTMLLERGNICSNMYYLEKGFARGFYSHEGKEITSWFAFEDDMITSMYSFIKQKSSFESIEILEDSNLNYISHTDLEIMYRKHPELNLIGRLINEEYYIRLENRTFSLQFLPAKERYKKLIEDIPQLLQRASLGHIASYLGVSQETLSRIRSKI